MRIAVVVHTFFPNWRAGTEVYARSVARKVIEQGHEAFVVCYEPPAENESFEGIRSCDTTWEGLPVHRISFFKRHATFHLKDYFHQEVEDLLFRYFSLIRPDVVHVVHAMHLTTASIWAAKRLGLPVVSTATDFWSICPTYQLVKWDDSLCDGPQALTCLACVTGGAAGVPLRRWAARRWLARVLSPVLTKLGKAHMFRAEWLPSLLWLSERQSWMKKTLAHVDVLLAPTGNTAKLITLNGLKPAEMRISGFGLEGHLRRAVETRGTDSTLRVGFVGTFRHSKGLHVLLEAMRRLPAGKARLDVYGSPGSFPEYDQTIRGLAEGLENVSFRNTFPNEQLPNVFAGFDVLAIPALWYENSPLVLLSAFALKTPVVASKVGSLADLVQHGKNGLLFEMGNADDLARQLLTLAENPGQVEQLRAGIPEVRTIGDNIDELLLIYAGLSRDCTVPRQIVQRPATLPRTALRWEKVWKFFKTRTLHAQFSEHLTLIRCKAGLGQAGEIRFDFQWHAPEISPKWVVFVHLVDENGDTQLQGDHPMVSYDQDPWGLVSYPLRVHFAEEHRGKSYRVRLGVWIPEAKTRLKVVRCRGWKLDAASSAIWLDDLHLA